MSQDDVLIIGGSFAGLAAALQLGRARRAVTVLDTGQNRNRFAGHSHGLLGHDHRPPAAILADARTQLQRYPSVRLVSARAEAISGASDDFVVTTSDGAALRARRLLLSYGVADQMPAIPGFADCWGRSIVSCPFCDGFEVADRHWGLLWSGEHSAHAAMLYGLWTGHRTVFANGHDISEAVRADLAARQVDLIEGNVIAIQHVDGQLSQIVLDTGASVSVDVLFAHPRSAPSAGLHAALGLAMVDHPLGQVIKVDDRRETSLAGIYAAGDLTSPMASVTLASSGGAMAGIFALQSMLV
ncbi:NAD(P)/FAD-dependent oxidoreductase [Devosia sp. FKR38]|uniref:NAD(P)/FAD-dependent oxidoreductase n=1 Tax=Devosia sp. FKR38 TaxID=2562312 RepID=UPI0010C0FD0F|nr:NAD(P)/FAD-dependent oxidoreductase [Devosia sp. FKR38]